MSAARKMNYLHSSCFEGRRLAHRVGARFGHAVLWHRAFGDRPAHFGPRAVCGARPHWRRGLGGWSDRAAPIDCPRCVAILAEARAGEAEALARSLRDRPGDLACRCHGYGCVGCMAKLPPCHACADCAHVDRCRAFGFTDDAGNPHCSFIPSRFVLARSLQRAGVVGQGGVGADAWPALRRTEESAAAGEGGAA